MLIKNNRAHFASYWKIMKNIELISFANAAELARVAASA
jgi:hypothetical protein